MSFSDSLLKKILKCRSNGSRKCPLVRLEIVFKSFLIFVCSSVTRIEFKSKELVVRPSAEFINRTYFRFFSYYCFVLSERKTRAIQHMEWFEKRWIALWFCKCSSEDLRGALTRDLLFYVWSMKYNLVPSNDVTVNWWNEDSLSWCSLLEREGCLWHSWTELILQPPPSPSFAKKSIIMTTIIV